MQVELIDLLAHLSLAQSSPYVFIQGGDHLSSPGHDVVLQAVFMKKT